jgi:hypothetical protein
MHDAREDWDGSAEEGDARLLWLRGLSYRTPTTVLAEHQRQFLQNTSDSSRRTPATGLAEHRFPQDRLAICYYGVHGGDGRSRSWG